MKPKPRHAWHVSQSRCMKCCRYMNGFPYCSRQNAVLSRHRKTYSLILNWSVLPPPHQRFSQLLGHGQPIILISFRPCRFRVQSLHPVVTEIHIRPGQSENLTSPSRKVQKGKQHDLGPDLRRSHRPSRNLPLAAHTADSLISGMRSTKHGFGPGNGGSMSFMPQFQPATRFFLSLLAAYPDLASF